MSLVLELGDLLIKLMPRELVPEKDHLHLFDSCIVSRLRNGSHLITWKTAAISLM